MRFDEGATIKVVALLYVCLVSYRNNSASLVHAVFDVSVCKANSGKVSYREVEFGEPEVNDQSGILYKPEVA